MPELPEVETVVRDLRPHLVGKTIVGASVHWQRTIATPSAREFVRDIRGYKIIALTRRGKHLVFHLKRGDVQLKRGDVQLKRRDVQLKRGDVHLKRRDVQLNVPTTKYLLVHLRMTGGFTIEPKNTPRDKHMHVIVELSDGRTLRFRDTRKFGRMWLVDDPEEVTGNLGPEPLEISAKEFHALFEHRRGSLKPVLLDQTFIAGVGNIYADESLWYAQLHPLRRAESLTRMERGRLYRAIRQVLTRAIAVGGTSIDVMYKRVNGASGGFQNSLRAFDREKRPCRRCGTLIVKTVVGQRGTHFCPTCQTR